MIPGRVPKQEKPEKKPTGYKPIEDLDEGITDWKTY
jgi:hypothetical protein